MLRAASLFGLLVSALTIRVDAAEPPPSKDVPAATQDAVRTAVSKGLTLVTQAALRYPEHRRCFSCHHQTLPLVAIHAAAATGTRDLAESDARKNDGNEKEGEKSDGNDTTRQKSGAAEPEPADPPATPSAQIVAFTNRFFDKQKKRLMAGQHIGGRAATAAYGLWAYEAADAKPSERTAAIVEYLLRTQREDGSWHPPSKGRPPLAESPVTLTVLAAIGFEKYATKEQAERVATALDRIRTFLVEYEPTTHEDFVFRLWGRWSLDFDQKDVDASRRELLARQRDDGGFAQANGMESDAFATGAALYVLHLVGEDPHGQPLTRMRDFLLKTQQEDGSWHVVTRAKAIQVYFDNGDPHGKDQFISTPATAWAVAGLAKTLDETATRPPAANADAPTGK